MPPLVIHAVGDVAPKRPDPASIFAAVRPALAGADLLFGQLECPLSSRGTPSPAAKLAMRSDPSVAATLRTVGFDVMSVAGNHALDFGAEALADTIRFLGEAGISSCGAGASLAQARAPAIVEAAGQRVAVLAYSSILPAGYAAEPNRPGCAPMRAYTHYEQLEPDQPGTPPQIITFADRSQLSALLDDIRQAKSRAEFVLLSFHWGVHFTRAVIADYQREIAHRSIEAGADAIFGHHPHLLKGIEYYRGKPVLYSLGNFAIEQPAAFKEDVRFDQAYETISALGSGWQPENRYMTPPETRHTVVARLTVQDDGAADLSLRPCRIDDDSNPQPLTAKDCAFADLVEYLIQITAEAGLNARYRQEGDFLHVLRP